MKREQFQETVTEVCQHLSTCTGVLWTLTIDSESWSNRATLTSSQGELLMINGGTEIQMQATIYGHLPHGYQGAHDRSQISLSLSKPASRIAREITSRLLEGQRYTTRYLHAVCAKARDEAVKQEQEESVTRIAQLLQVEPYKCSGYDEAPRLPGFSITDEVRGHLELEYDGMWSLDLKGLTEQQVTQLLTIVHAGLQKESLQIVTGLHELITFLKETS